MDNNQQNYSYGQDRSQYRESGSQYGSQYNAYSDPQVQQGAPTIRLGSDNSVYASSYQKKSEKSSSGVVRGVIIGAIVAVVISGLVSVLLMNMYVSRMQDNLVQNGNEVTLQISESPVTNTESSGNEGERLSYAQVAAKVGRAVVSVNVYTSAYGWGSYIYSEGSGFIISTDGYIVTNSHVVQDEEYSKFKITVNVQNEDGTNSEYEAEVIGHDTRTDLAVLKLKEPVDNLVTVELGDSQALVLGDEVVAIGNPGGGQFAGSVTNGIVSGIDRVIDEETGTSDSAMKYLQTNAAINPGNSGGPLLNMYGQVIGINTAKIIADGYEGLGFAIPMNTAKPIIEELIEVGSVVRPILGISATVVTEQMAEWYDVPVGIMIREINQASSLAKSDVRIGDIITKCDGVDIATLAQLQEIVEQHEVGDTITLTIFRSGVDSQFEVKVTLIGNNSVVTAQNVPDNPFMP